MNPAKTIALPWLVSAGLVIALVAGLNLIAKAQLGEPPSPIRGATAVGVAADGSLIIRSHLCTGAPSEVTVHVGTMNSGPREIARLAAATEIRADLPGIDANTTMTIGSENTEAVLVSLTDWMKLTPGQWLVTDAAADGPHNQALTADELPSWAC